MKAIGSGYDPIKKQTFTVYDTDIPIPPHNSKPAPKRETVKVWRWADERYHEVPAKFD